MVAFLYLRRCVGIGHAVAAESLRALRLPLAYQSRLSSMVSQPPRPSGRDGFEIAIICALPLEADAIGALFDRYWDDDGLPFDKTPGDPNAYTTGVIGRHNVVLAHMPGMGKATAAAVASKCQLSFPNIRLGLVVGICGVVPFKSSKEEIVLGDVIVSNGVIQYDFGRQLPGRFTRKNTLLESLGKPNLEILGVIAKLKALRSRRQISEKMAEYLAVLRQEPGLNAEYPGLLMDKLFEPSYCHTEEQKSCEQLGCSGKLVQRSRLETGANPTPALHLGTIASGDSVMRSGEDRDRIAAAEDIIAFEMEGAGVWDIFPCIVIKGACDYADSHKSKVWQRYAAATAAACMKALLSFWVPSFVQENISCPASNLESSLSLQNQGCPDQKETVLSTDEPQRKPVFLVPFPENELFVGRENILATLQSLLFEQERRNVALVGLGGIGKTQAALQFAYWVKKTEPDYSVFWMPAFNHASFEQACMQVTRACGIQTTDGEDTKESVFQYLGSKHAGKWLLVVDNADDARTVMGSADVEDGIYRFLPKSDQGRTLFTTRDRKVAVSVARQNTIQVPEMSLDEARSYLEQALIRKDLLEDDQAVRDLLALLTYLPLAITQAAAYLNENQIPITKYLDLFKNTDRDRMELMSAEFQDDTRYKQSQDPVATTWFISFHQIRKADKFASRILMFLACVEPKAVPRSILPDGKSRQQLTRAIGTLCGYGFLSRRGTSEMFDMHSLVHLATTSWVAKHDSETEQRRAAVARLAEVFPTDDWENRDIWRQYLPHAIRLLSMSEDVESESLCELGYWVGRCLLIDGRVAEAVATLRDVVAAEKTTLAENHPNRLASQHALAGAYQANGQVKEAVELLEHVVAIEETTLADNHPSRLASQNALARAYQANGQVKEAVELLEHVVAIEETIVAEDHPSRLASQHNLAGAYQTDGQIKKAIELLEHVVAIRETIVAEDHPSRLASQHNLARAYQIDGQTEKAVGLLEQLAAIKKRKR